MTLHRPIAEDWFVRMTTRCGGAVPYDLARGSGAPLGPLALAGPAGLRQTPWMAPMQPEDLENAYVRIVRELRDGDFEPPTEGWAAEHIAAHVALNNDCLTDAARDLLAGLSASYDNESVVDINELTAYASKFLLLGDLADDVARSAIELAMALGDIRTQDADSDIAVVMHHDGRIVRDGPASLVELIEANATFHLSTHLDQLLALRPAR